MPNWVWGVTGLLVGTMIANVIIGVVSRMSPPVQEKAVALREQFPYTSLRERLTYELQSTSRDPDDTQPLLFDETLKRLEKIEVAFDNNDSRARLVSLQKLHSQEVGYFLKRPMNGLGRWGRLPGPGLLNYSEPEPIPLDGSPSRDEVPSEGVRRFEEELATNDPEALPPSFKELSEFHLTGLMSFVDPYSLGDVRNVEQVAGFVSHGFRSQPTIGDPRNAYPRAYDADEQKSPPSVWKVARLELVSLLKFETPQVYVSDSLPQMNRINDAERRSLNPFEQEALETLRGGEDLVTADRDDAILMFGSLRAATKCLECHTGQRGKLLGAFSYELRRRPTPAARGQNVTEPLGD